LIGFLLGLLFGYRKSDSFERVISVSHKAQYGTLRRNRLVNAPQVNAPPRWGR